MILNSDINCMTIFSDNKLSFLSNQNARRHPWPDKELEEIERQVLAEEIRGSTLVNEKTLKRVRNCFLW